MKFLVLITCLIAAISSIAVRSSYRTDHVILSCQRCSAELQLSGGVVHFGIGLGDWMINSMDTYNRRSQIDIFCFRIGKSDETSVTSFYLQMGMFYLMVPIFLAKAYRSVRIYCLRRSMGFR